MRLDIGSYNYLILALLRLGASDWAEHLWHNAGASSRLKDAIWNFIWKFSLFSLIVT